MDSVHSVTPYNGALSEVMMLGRQMNLLRDLQDLGPQATKAYEQHYPFVVK